MYLPFVAGDLNYINWIIDSVLHTANVFCKTLGMDTYVTMHDIRVPQGVGVRMSFACIGFGIMSLWIAFITAHKTNLKTKLVWSLGGVFTIWFINCCRIAILLIALDHRSKVISFIDHHTIFNLVTYSVIAFIMYLYIRSEKESLSFTLRTKLV